MEPLSALSAAANIIQAIDYLDEALRDDPADGWTAISPKTTFLGVLDITLNQSASSRVLATLTESSQLDTVLQSLPNQNSGTCRVYIEEGLRSNESFHKHLSALVSSPLPDHDWGSNAFHQLASQWRLSSFQPSTWVLETYGRDTSSMLGAGFSPGSSMALSASLTRMSNYVRVTSDTSGRILMFISCKSEMMALEKVFRKLSRTHRDIPRPAAAGAHSRLESLCTNLVDLVRMYEPQLVQNVSVEARKQLLLLLFCHANLLHGCFLLDGLQLSYTPYRMKLFDPRRATLTSSSLEEITRDAYLFGLLHHSFSNLTSSTESLLRILGINVPGAPGFNLLSAELHCICEDLQKRTSSLQTSLENSLKFIELRKTASESGSLWLLSLLASIFLPLSLASSLLSMQTRLVELHFLIYDFCGVIILLGTIVIAVIVYLKLYLLWSEKLAKWDSNIAFRTRIRPIIDYSTWSWIVISWALALSSFLIGMIKDVGLGLRILGIGAAIVGGSMLVTVCGAGLLWSLISKI